MKKVLAVALVIGAAWAAEGYKVISKIKIGGEGRWDYEIGRASCRERV